MSKAHTIVVGDTHMYWPALLRALHHFRPEACIVAGDFGWWPETWGCGPLEKRLDWLLAEKPSRTEIRFIEGNHENLPLLFGEAERVRRKVGAGSFDALEMRPGLWYQPRGSMMTLVEGSTVFFCGGGKSVDAPLRIEGLSWFPEEIVTRDQLPDVLPEADVVISHTVPNRLGVLETLPPVFAPDWDLAPDPTSAVLDEVFDAVSPSLWIASHLHVFRRGRVGKTHFVVLDRTDGNAKPWEDFSMVLVP